MLTVTDLTQRLLWSIYETLRGVPLPVLFLLFLSTVATGIAFLYVLVLFLAPLPRAAYPSEKKYITTTPSGTVSKPQALPCWHDEWLAHRQAAEKAGDADGQDAHTGTIDGAELQMSVVIPAYNEAERIEVMLEEAVEYLDKAYGRVPGQKKTRDTETSPRKKEGHVGGYEILVVDDGSKDKTVDVVLAFSLKHKLHDVLRICKLKENRGKGGAVTHGFRHVRGAYAVFADADGASKFRDLGKLVEGCDAVSDEPRRGIAVGSRAHLVGSEAVVKRSAIRNALMHSFHVLLKILTPPATSRIRDTQCGFKLFSRASLPHIVPYMHAEGWIFDVEMLLLAESAPEGIISGSEGRIGTTPGIRVAEVPIGWHEVGGSKLNVMWDSLGMAWGLALLRASWMFGVYRRR